MHTDGSLALTSLVCMETVRCYLGVPQFCRIVSCTVIMPKICSPWLLKMTIVVG